MPLSDKTLNLRSYSAPTFETPPRHIDFTVDSAGNVSPGTRERAARMGEHPSPRPDSPRRSG